MRVRIFSLALLLACVPAWASPPDVPKAIKAQPGQVVRVVVKSDAEVGSARSFTDEEAFFDELVSKKGERRFLFQATKAGTYVLAFWTKGEVEGTVCTITVGDSGPPPPPPPPPDDALSKAYAAEADPLKATHVARLAALYRAWEKAVLDTPPPTWGKLFEAMAASSKSMALADKVPAVRAVLADEFRRTFPTSSATVLTQDGRALASATFARAATRLEALR